MTSQMDQPEQQQPPWLKAPEQEINQENIWQHDALSRAQMAESVASIVANPRGLSTISIHGGWGTGKTFFLTRLRWQLKKDGFEAIYFNAWEDDFLHDPLLAILGQLAQDLRGRRYGKLVKGTFNTGSKLVRQLPIVAAKQVTGLDLGAAFESQDTLADTYKDLIKTKTELKKKLNTLAARVAGVQEGRPLVFIIDELDRCRPTFAIELMERVKHIFDVPNLLFVFGINRDEMEESLQSIYGGIDSDTYLRRFFDLELNLPPSNRNTFTRKLVRDYGLPQYFGELFAGMQRPSGDDLSTVDRYLPSLLDGLQVSLRDAQSCVRLLSVIARSQKRLELFVPVVVVGLTALRTVNHKLYRDFVRGDVRTGEVIDWLDERASKRVFTKEEFRQWSRVLSVIEAQLYRSDIERRADSDAESSLDAELTKLRAGEQIEHPKFVSRRLANLGQDEVHRVNEMVTYNSPYPEGDAVSKIAGMLELSAQYIRE